MKVDITLVFYVAIYVYNCTTTSIALYNIDTLSPIPTLFVILYITNSLLSLYLSRKLYYS